MAQDKQVVQGEQRKNDEIIHQYIEEFLLQFDTAIRSLAEARQHIEKYIENIKGKLDKLGKAKRQC